MIKYASRVNHCKEFKARNFAPYQIWQIQNLKCFNLYSNSASYHHSLKINIAGDKHKFLIFSFNILVYLRILTNTIARRKKKKKINRFTKLKMFQNIIWRERVTWRKLLNHKSNIAINATQILAFVAEQNNTYQWQMLGETKS